jgi:hypothetical protein
MPYSVFAQELGRGGITHWLCDFEAKLGLAAMIESVVHAFDSRSLLFLFDPVSKRLLKLPSMQHAMASGCAVLTNQLLEAS